MGQIVKKVQKLVREDKTKTQVEEKKLEGLPKDVIQKLEKVPGKEGYRYFKIKDDLGAAMKMVKDEKTRENLKFAAA